MTVPEIIGLSVALAIMLVGIIGSVLPGLPGAPLILVAAIAHRVWFGPQSIGNAVLITLIVFTGLALLLDYLATMLGARRFGATWRGAIGAAGGAVVGIFFGLPGVLIGPFVGATLLEAVGGYELKKAAHAGLGATMGLVAGVLGRCAICTAMTGLFAANVLYRTLH